MRALATARGRAAGAVLVAAALYSLAYPPFGWAWLLALAPIPLLRVLDRSTPSAAAAAGAGFGALIAVFIVAWIGPTLAGYYERSLPFTVVLLVLLWATMGAPFYAVAFAALAFARPRLSRGAWLLLVPAGWVAAEWGRSELGLQAAWALVGDAFAGWSRLRQMADVTGVYGISFLVVLGSVVASEAPRVWRGARERRAWATVAAAFLGLTVLAIGYGEARLAQLARPADGPELDVLLVQGNVESELRWRRTQASRVLHRYASLTREGIAGRTPDLVIWPENAVQTAIDDATYGPALAGLVRAVEAPLLLGAPRAERVDGRSWHYNSAFLLAPAAAADHYDKRRLMPFGERDPFGEAFDAGRRGDLDGGRWRAGERAGVLAVGDHRLGVLICLEALYPSLARDVVASGAQVIVNLSNDSWFRGRGGPEQHFQQVVFRAIETRRPLLRVTTTGVTAVVAPDGSVRRRLGWGERGTLRVAVKPGAGEAGFYLRYGDVAAAASTGALAGGVALAAVRRRATRLPEPPGARV